MLAVLLLAGLTLCQSQKAYDSREDYGQLYQARSVEIAYEDEFDSIRQVDFKNLIVHVFDDSGKVSLKARLKKGKYSHEEPLDFQYVWFRSVHYLDSNGKEPGRAIVKFGYQGTAVSSCNSVMIQVFELRGKRLFLTQNIDFGEQDESDTRFDWKRNTLQIVAIHPCDPWSFKLAIGFRWDGAKFRKVSLKEIPTPMK
jgi:hypothetical protein